MPGTEEEKSDQSLSPQGPQTLFRTPARDLGGAGTETFSSLLSPVSAAVPAFTQHVIALLQRVVEGNDSAIEFGVSEFLKQFRITNEFGLSLLEEKDVPTGPPDSIWTLPTFRKAFLTVCSGCAEIPIGPYTSFNTLR